MTNNTGLGLWCLMPLSTIFQFVAVAPSLVRPLLLKWKGCVIRGVESIEGGNLVIFSLSVQLKSGLIRVIAFGGSGLIRDGLLCMQLRETNDKYFLEGMYRFGILL